MAAKYLWKLKVDVNLELAQHMADKVEKIVVVLFYIVTVVMSRWVEVLYSL